MDAPKPSPPEGRYELLHRIGMALSGERDRDRLLDLILSEAQALCHADGGTLYLLNEHEELEFAIVKNTSLNINLGGISGSPVHFPPLPLTDERGRPNRKNVATYAVHERRLVHIPDAYDVDTFDFSGTQRFDERSGYRSKSFLTIPLVSSEDRVIGVLQLLNAKDPETGEVISFFSEHQQTVQALASQAAIALDNKLLMEAQKDLLESFIKMIAAAIDAKSPYTGAHCERVPALTEMLVQKVVEQSDGPFKDFTLTEEQFYEVHIAAWLHDCGKVTTPTHVMDKATKLETISDRMEVVRARFEILRRDAEIAYLKAELGGGDKAALSKQHADELAKLDEDLRFLETSNIGGEFLPPEAQARIFAMAARTVVMNGVSEPLLSAEEVDNLTISRGTLTHDERLIINGHMVQTVRMLDALPFPRNLKRVPEYASGHHEKMDGGGYPRGIFAGDMSVPARALAIADVFEALTANDRPYKQAKKLSEAMRIMGFMKKDNHLDPDLFDLFVTSGVYRAYAEKYLDPSLIDDVDEAALLALQPRAFDFPDEETRKLRMRSLLPEYEARFPVRDGATNPFTRTG